MKKPIDVYKIAKYAKAYTLLKELGEDFLCDVIKHDLESQGFSLKSRYTRYVFIWNRRIKRN